MANLPGLLADSGQKKLIIHDFFCRKYSARYIQKIGQRLNLSQLCINTAVVYMQKFFKYHSFTDVNKYILSLAALHLASKVEQENTRLRYIVKLGYVFCHPNSPPLDVRSKAYYLKLSEVLRYKRMLLKTIGSNLIVDHPHAYIARVCEILNVSKDLRQTSYFLATISLHLTTFCLQYSPTVIACVCIHLACKWTCYKIEPNSKGEEWYHIVDNSVTSDLLETLTTELAVKVETPLITRNRKCRRNSTAVKRKSSCGSNKGVNGSSVNKVLHIKEASQVPARDKPGPSKERSCHEQKKATADSCVPPPVPTTSSATEHKPALSTNLGISGKRPASPHDILSPPLKKMKGPASPRRLSVDEYFKRRQSVLSKS